MRHASTSSTVVTKLICPAVRDIDIALLQTTYILYLVPLYCSKLTAPVYIETTAKAMSGDGGWSE